MELRPILLLVLSLLSTNTLGVPAERALSEATNAEIKQSLHYCLSDTLAKDRMPTITLTPDLIEDVRAALQSEPKSDVVEKLAGVLQRIRGIASDYQSHDQGRSWTEKFAKKFTSNLIYRINNQRSYRLGGGTDPHNGRPSRRAAATQHNYNCHILQLCVLVFVLAVWAFNHFFPDMAGASVTPPMLPPTEVSGRVSGRSRPTNASRVRTISDWDSHGSGEPSSVRQTQSLYAYTMTGRR